MLKLTHLEGQIPSLARLKDAIDNTALRRLIGGLNWVMPFEPSNVLPLVDIRFIVPRSFADASVYCRDETS